jgi:nucleotide-binding universal stress UspA family protein
MMKKTMICVNLESDTLDHFKSVLSDWQWSKNDEVHFVHGFQVQYYADNFNITTFPGTEDQKGIESAVIEALLPFEDQVLSGAQKPKVFNKCILASNTKSEIVKYAKDNEIDEMIISTKLKSGIDNFFSSSFTEYMLRHANCSIRVLRIK